jgi:FlaA1/EpsC-like NDP-sugar epimerase
LIDKSNNFIKDYIIYGAGDAGRQIYSSLENINKKVFCFIDDNKQKQSKNLYGKKIISYKKFKDLVKITKFENLIIAIPSLSNKKFLKIKNYLKNKIPNIEFVPLKNKLKSDFVTIEDLSNLDVSSIIRRKSKLINYKLIQKEYKNKNILITGGCGSIGSQLCRNLLNVKANKIIILDNSEISLFHFKNEMASFKNVIFYLGDILDKKLVDFIIKNENINIIFHTAAYKHVNILEENIHSAFRNNILGTKSILDVAKNYKEILVVTISTDKAVKPKNILGVTKRISELIALSYNEYNLDSRVVRFGNVFGSKGSAIPTFIEQINNKLPITITSRKATRYFMTINEACYLLMLSIKIKKPTNVLIFNMGKPVKIIEVINKLIRIKKKFNKNYNFKIKNIGLKKGEKLNEQLSIFKNLKKTKIKDIKITSDPLYQKNELLFLLKLIETNTNANFKMAKLKFFLKKEIKA